MPLNEMEKDLLYRTKLWPKRVAYGIIAILGALAATFCYFAARSQGRVDVLTFFITAMLVGFFVSLFVHTVMAGKYRPKNYAAVEGVFIYKRECSIKGNSHYFVYIKAPDGRFYRADDQELYHALNDHVIYTHKRDDKSINIRFIVYEETIARSAIVPNTGAVVYRDALYIRTSDNFFVEDKKDEKQD